MDRRGLWFPFSSCFVECVSHVVTEEGGRDRPAGIPSSPLRLDDISGSSSSSSLWEWGGTFRRPRSSKEPEGGSRPTPSATSGEDFMENDADVPTFPSPPLPAPPAGNEEEEDNPMNEVVFGISTRAPETGREVVVVPLSTFEGEEEEEGEVREWESVCFLPSLFPWSCSRGLWRVVVLVSEEGSGVLEKHRERRGVDPASPTRVVEFDEEVEIISLVRRTSMFNAVSEGRTVSGGRGVWFSIVVVMVVDRAAKKIGVGTEEAVWPPVPLGKESGVSGSASPWADSIEPLGERGPSTLVCSVTVVAEVVERQGLPLVHPFSSSSFSFRSSSFCANDVRSWQTTEGAGTGVDSMRPPPPLRLENIHGGT